MTQHLWSISGISRPYTGNGRRFGCPTANFPVDPGVPEGIYLSETLLNGVWHDSVLFVGTPEVEGDNCRRAETHIFDIEDRDYYGTEVVVHCIAALRPVGKFPDGELELRLQISRDLAWARIQHEYRRRGGDALADGLPRRGQDETCRKGGS